MNRYKKFGLSSMWLLIVLSGCAGTPSQDRMDQVAVERLTQTPPVADATIPSVSPTGSALDSNAYYVSCAGQVRDLGAILSPIASKMVAQKIPYSQQAAGEWRDCSGNFLRLSSYLAEACPELNGSLVATKGIADYKRGANNTATATAAARTTRGIAKWYSQNGRFTPVYYDRGNRAAVASHRHLIRPGAVLWFSRTAPKRSAGLTPLFARQINHMGTVISVQRNQNGDVVGYSMYHGRRPGKRATITEKHYWDWPRAYTSRGQSYPPLGYWKQYLVGIGSIAPAHNS